MLKIVSAFAATIRSALKARRDLALEYWSTTFPSMADGSESLDTEEALDRFSGLRAREIGVTVRQPMEGRPSQGLATEESLKEANEEATRMQEAATKRRKPVPKRRAKESANKPRTAKRTKLHTLSAASAKTGISMPTLIRYKREHQARIPSVGESRTQRYPEEALPVFKAIKEENMAKRGRPRKKAAVKKSVAKKAVKETAKKAVAKKKAAKKTAPVKTKGKKAAAKKAATVELLTLTEIQKRTGIAYPTLARHVKLHGSRIPSQGEGRKRRYPEEAVAVFTEIRGESKRGRKPVAKRVAKKRAARKKVAIRRPTTTDKALAARIREIERGQKQIDRQLRQVIKMLKKPIEVRITSG